MSKKSPPAVNPQSEARTSPEGAVAEWSPELHRPISKARLATARKALHNPIATSEDHKQSLYGMRELLDEIARLRQVAVLGWRTAQALAIASGARRSEEAADQALEQLEET